MDRKAHWERVYTTKGERDVSWFETLAQISLDMLDAAGVTRATCVLDVGGGDSRLIDHLASRGMDCLAVLNVSGAALQRAQARLGDAARVPIWIEADVAGDWTLKPIDVWHDRAVFHFLTDPEDRARYLSHLRSTLKATGSAIIATFALDGPESGAACRWRGTHQNHSPKPSALAMRWSSPGDTSIRRRGAARKRFSTPGLSDFTEEFQQIPLPLPFDFCLIIAVRLPSDEARAAYGSGPRSGASGGARPVDRRKR
jgi:SAM-dependent methyltransferase